MSVKLYKLYSWPLPHLPRKASRVCSSVQVRTPLASIAQSRGVVVDASDMVSRKKARAELHKGRRAEKKSEHGEAASKTGATAPKNRTKASKTKTSKIEKAQGSQVWQLLAVLCHVRSTDHHRCVRIPL
jgi:hypothetical protein